MANGFKSGLWSRSSRLLGMAAQVAGHEARHRVRRTVHRGAEAIGGDRLATTLEQAKVFADSLSQLKGAAMKAGQLLSIDASDYLPPEAVEALTKLQADADPVDFAVVRGVLEADLGADWAERLEQLDPTPAASASIGQVHRATVDGRPVAVKVQYPGVADAIDADLDLLRKLSGAWLGVSGRRIDLEDLFEEMKEVLHQETDYAIELARMRAFADLTADHPERVVPEPFEALSGPRVMVCGWEDGWALSRWIASHPPAEARRWFGRALLDLYCDEFFRWGLVQTDPNPGNFLVRPEDRQVVLLDFGATLEYDDAFRRDYVALLQILGRGEPRAVIDAGVERGMLDPRESAEVRDLFAEVLIAAVEPFMPDRQPFAFADADYAARTRDAGIAFTRALRYSPPPRRLVFLHRKLGGIFNILKRLDLELDLTPYWARMVGTEIRPAA